jgi:predicted  nucleic acid-binding Zn-ribbon protein
MEKQIMNMLSDIQRNMKEFDQNLKELDRSMKGLDGRMQGLEGNMKEFKSDLKEIKETVNRIEASQTENVIAMLKVGNQHSETDFHYLNTRITDIDKRVFNLENRAEG